MRMTLPSAIIMAAAIWRTRILMSGSPLPDKQDRNRGQAHESLSFFVRGRVMVSGDRAQRLIERPFLLRRSHYAA